MKRSLLGSVICLTLALIISSCGSKKKKVEPSTTVVKKIEQVRTITIKQKEVERKVELPTTLKAWEEVHLAPSSPGRIEHFMVDVSTVVKKGDVLVQMDRTQLLQSELQMKNYETEFNRAKILYEAGSYSEQNYDQIKTQYEVAKTNMEYLRTNTIMKAPFTGIVSGKYFEDGEMYSGTPISTIGKAAVLSLVEIDKLKTTIAVPESYYPLIKLGMLANITSDVYPGKTFTGTVNIKYPTIDPATRTFDVELKINNPSNILRPGMFARVNLFVGKNRAMLVPDYAVLKMQGSNERYVFVNNNGVVDRLVVTIGDRFNDQIEVISDKLKEGMDLIVEGQARLNQGSTINVVK